MESVSEHLRELREEKDWKQIDVAHKLGITQQIYSNYELGKCELPVRHLVRLANMYDVSTDYLLGRSSYPKILPQSNEAFVQKVSLGDFICKVLSFDARSRGQLVQYVNYLSYLDTLAKAKKKSDIDFPIE